MGQQGSGPPKLRSAYISIAVNAYSRIAFERRIEYIILLQLTTNRRKKTQRIQ